MKNIIIGISIGVMFLFSCKKEKSDDKDDTTPPISAKFATDVQPIFQQSCGTGGSCHGTGNAADGKVYETHAGASAINGAKTKGAINHSPGFHAMPKNLSKLSSEKIAIIEAWIDGGKLND